MKISNLNYLTKVMLSVIGVMIYFSCFPTIIQVQRSYYDFLGVILLGGIIVNSFLLFFISLSFCINGCKFDETTSYRRDELLNQIGMNEEELKKEAIKKYLLEVEVNKLTKKLI